MKMSKYGYGIETLTGIAGGTIDGGEFGSNVTSGVSSGGHFDKVGGTVATMGLSIAILIVVIIILLYYFVYCDMVLPSMVGEWYEVQDADPKNTKKFGYMSITHHNRHNGNISGMLHWRYKDTVKISIVPTKDADKALVSKTAKPTDDFYMGLRRKFSRVCYDVTLEGTLNGVSQYNWTLFWDSDAKTMVSTGSTPKITLKWYPYDPIKPLPVATTAVVK